MKKKLRMKCSLLVTIFMLLLILCAIKPVSAQTDATAWFNKGASASSPQEKIICYSRAIELNPKFIEAYYNLGYVYKNLDDLANAEKAFRQAILSDPDKLSNDDLLRISYELGITLKRLNRFKDALEMLNVSKNLATKTEIRAAVLFEIGKLKVSMENFDEAVAEFNEGLQLRSSKQDAFQSAIQSVNSLREVENQYKQAIAYFDNAQYDRAIEILSRVIETNPNYKDVPQKLVQAQSFKNQRTQADELDRTYSRGIGYMQNNDWKNAILAFTQINQSNPDYKDVKLKLEEAKAKLDQSFVEEGYEQLYSNGVTAYNEKDWVKAMLAFEKVREWNPNYKNVRRMYGDVQNQLSQEEQSIVKLRYYNQGRSDLASGDLEAAISSFEQLVRLDSNFRDAQQLLNQAKKEFQRANEVSQLDKFYADAMKNIDDGEWLQAIVMLEKLQQLKPGYRDVNEKLLLAQQGYTAETRTDEVVDLPVVATATKGRSNNLLPVGALLSLFIIPLGIIFFIVPTGRVKLYLMQGKYQKAAGVYESLLLKKPHRVKLYVELAQIYLLQKRKDETALKVYNISLQQNINTKLKEKLIEFTDRTISANTKKNEVKTLEEQLKMELENLTNKTI